jgi:hypothetical protein
VKLGVVGSRVSHPSEAPYLLSTTIPQLFLQSFLAIPAAFMLYCGPDSCFRKLFDSCSLRPRRSYTAPADDADADDNDIEDVNAPIHANAGQASTGTAPKLPGFLSAGVWSRAFFSWLTPLMKVGYKRALEVDDIPGLAPSDRGCVVSHKFNENWAKQVRVRVLGHLIHCTVTPPLPQLRQAQRAGKVDEGYVSVAQALKDSCGRQMYPAALFKLLNDLLAFAGPYLLNAIVKYLQV